MKYATGRLGFQPFQLIIKIYFNFLIYMRQPHDHLVGSYGKLTSS
jgi:hypothetical protein